MVGPRSAASRALLRGDEQISTALLEGHRGRGAIRRRARARQMPEAVPSFLSGGESVSTSTTADEVDRRQRGYRKTPKSLTESLLQATRDALLDIEGASWSFDGYSADPVGFAVDVLGAVILPKDYEPTDEELFVWHREKRLILWWRQIEVLEAVRDHLPVAVASGHKVSKSTTAAILALWYYCCFDEARVVLSSKTARQVDGILWRGAKEKFRRAHQPIPGQAFHIPRTRLNTQD